MNGASDQSGSAAAEGFDAYAGSYDAVLNRALAISGEDKDYFARQRVIWLHDRLQRAGVRARRVLDFGCGTGTAVPLLLELLRAETVTGVDVSSASLEVARQVHAGPATVFRARSDYRPCGEMDLAFCNGVFHHIDPEHRGEAVEYVCGSLRSGGLFALWENNPWNPGARYCMRVNPFDRDARPLSSGGARWLVREAGLRVLETSYRFIFPRLLAGLRWLETPLCRLPLGAQYLVLCRKP